MCLLLLNSINDKVYLILWFWLFSLAIISALVLVYRCLVACFPVIRTKVTLWHSSIVKKEDLTIVFNHGGVGDWFLLNLLSKNLDPVSFRDLVLQLKLKLNEGKKNV